MTERFSLGLKIAAGFAIALLILGAIGLTSYMSMMRLLKSARSEGHTHEVLEKLERVLSLAKDIETGARTFVLTGSEQYLAHYDRALNEIEQDMIDLRLLTSDNPAQQHRLDRLDHHVAEELARSGNLIKLRKDKRLSVSLMTSLSKGKEVMEGIRKSIAEMQDEEHILLTRRTIETKTSARTVTAVILIGSVLALMLVGLAGVLISRDMAWRKQAEKQLEASHTHLTGWVRELEREAREQTLLSELGDLLQTCLTTEEAHTVIAKGMKELFPSTRGSLYLISGARHGLEAMASWEQSGGMQPHIFQLEACWALRRGHLHAIKDPLAGPCCGHLDSAPLSGYFCLPLMAQGEVMGLLHAQSLLFDGASVDDPQIFPSDSHRRLAVIVGEHISLALANLRLREALRSQSIRDSLTGLFNRRYMEESLDRELHRAMRSRTPLGVVMIDLDFFKQFNDRFGHAAGDTLLTNVGDFLRMQIRAEDIACRYGGEEFVLILPGSSLDATRMRAEQVRDDMSRVHVEHGGRSLGTLTLSAGVAGFPSDGMTAKAVLQAADEALYHAKSSGRDRVVVSSFLKENPQSDSVPSHSG